MRNKDEKYQKETINLINLNHQVALVIFCSQNFTNESKTCLRRGSLTYDGTEFFAHLHRLIRVASGEEITMRDACTKTYVKIVLRDKCACSRNLMINIPTTSYLKNIEKEGFHTRFWESRTMIYPKRITIITCLHIKNSHIINLHLGIVNFKQKPYFLYLFDEHYLLFKCSLDWKPRVTISLLEKKRFWLFSTPVFWDILVLPICLKLTIFTGAGRPAPAK